MTDFRVFQAAAILGVSDDTVRRYVALGALPVRQDESNRRVIDDAALAAFARENLVATSDPSEVASSARKWRCNAARIASCR